MPIKVCPWWLTYTFDNPLRRLLHDAEGMLRPHVRAGMRVADLGCGMGYFTVALARLVGSNGHVQAVDLQPQQLARVRARCARAGLEGRVELTRAEPATLGLAAPLDFVLAIWMVHEVPSAECFFTEVGAALVPGGAVLIAEPKIHVSRGQFAASLDVAQRLGFAATPVAGIRISRAALLRTDRPGLIPGTDPRD